MRYESRVGCVVTVVDAPEATPGQLAAIDVLRRDAMALRTLQDDLWLMVGKALLDGAGREHFDHLMDGIADAMYTA